MVKSRIVNAINISKSNNQIITHDEKIALRELKEDEVIQIVKVDKGNGTVVIDKKEYKDKIL